MCKILIDKENNLIVQVDIAFGRLEKSNSGLMTVETDFMLESIRNLICSITCKKKLTKEDKKALENYLDEYVKYELLYLAGIKSYPIVQDETGKILGIDEQIEIIKK